MTLKRNVETQNSPKKKIKKKAKSEYVNCNKAKLLIWSVGSMKCLYYLCNPANLFVSV